MRPQRLVAGALAVSALALAAPSGIASADPRAGGCPPRWMLQPVTLAIPGIDRGNFKDRNGDGYICAKQHKDTSWTVKDNKVRRR